MEIVYFVFWIDTQREIYGDNHYFVLGELMGSFDTHDEAVKYIEELNMTNSYGCTILPIYRNKI